MDLIIIFAFVAYFLYHIASRSDLFKGLRDWARRCLPAWMVYPLQCVFCWTFHCGWILTLLTWFWTGYLSLPIGYLFVAPVMNLVLDLVVQHLISLNSTIVVTNGDSLSARIKQVAIQAIKEQTRKGGMVDTKLSVSHGGTSTPQMSYGDGVKIPPSMMMPPFNPLDHEQTK